MSAPQVPLDDEKDQGLSLTPTFSKTQLLTIFSDMRDLVLDFSDSIFHLSVPRHENPYQNNAQVSPQNAYFHNF